MDNTIIRIPELLEDWTEATSRSVASLMEKVQKAVRSLTAATYQVKRVLAGFDQINRVGEKKKTGSARKSSKKESAATGEELTEQTQNVFTLKKALDDLDATVLESVICQLPGLSTAVSVLHQAGQTLYTTWQERMMPVGQWIRDSLIPLVGQQLGAGFQNAGNVLSVFGSSFQKCWQDMGTASNRTACAIGESMLGITDSIDRMVLAVYGDSLSIGSSTGEMTEKIGNAARQITGSLGILQSGWSTVLGDMQAGVGGFSSGTVGGLQTVADYLRGTFSSQWQEGFEGLKTPAKGAFNGVVGFMNKVLSGLGGTVNGMVEVINSLKIKIPDWVPVLGGKQYGFSLKTVSTPEIPYLAQGAVLPANQPFLAVVGDQKHGTNVEAPLSTIQEAVEAVMADHTAGNMAGHEATVAVLQQILEAVLGIDVGEAVIARAAQSYRMKEAVMKGGGF